MAECRSCEKKFAAFNSLHQHMKAAPRHASCSTCRGGFQSITEYTSHYDAEHAPTRNAAQMTQPGQTPQPTQAPQPLIEGSSQGLKDNSLPLAIASSPVTPPWLIYTGVLRTEVEPVFQMAKRLRFRRPTPQTVIYRTGTRLDRAAVASIIESALRILPVDYSGEGTELRQEQEAARAREAKTAENNFVERLLAADPKLLREDKQRARHDAASYDGDYTTRLTPDALFSSRRLICGAECAWVEYKDNFGFRSSPFLAKRHSDQLQRYRSALGPGMVVFRHGYETDHIRIDGVHCFREAEVLLWLDQLQLNQPAQV